MGWQYQTLLAPKPHYPSPSRPPVNGQVRPLMASVRGWQETGRERREFDFRAVHLEPLKGVVYVFPTAPNNGASPDCTSDRRSAPTSRKGVAIRFSGHHARGASRQGDP